MDDQRSPIFGRPLRSPEFWLLAVSAAVAAAGLDAATTIPFSLAGLTLSSMPKYIALWPRARAAGATGVWWSTVALSMLNNLAASCAAFLLGLAIRWLWT
jgi:hypothetical protein